MVNQIIEFIKTEASVIPLEIFSFLGSLLEEIIAPIPSPLVMTLAGTMAHSQNKPLIYLLWIALFASITKTITAYIYYLIADKAEDVLLNKFGKYIGITHQQMEAMGKNFNGSWSDDLIIFLARAIPIVPTSLVSLACGFIKVHIRTFIWSSFFGFIIRSLIFLYLGYSGMAKYQDLAASGFVDISISNIIVFIIICVTLGLAYYYKNETGLQKLINKFIKPKD